ncbi:MAG: sorting protein [Verrucomicrobiales bacterium]|nr:sorting protein [Verrucomicrobiales bacterium]
MKPSAFLPLALVAGFCLQSAPQARAATFTIQPLTEAESKDTKIYVSVPNSNFSSNLTVVSSDITDFRSLVQFDLSAIAGLTAADITTASLRLYATGLNTNALSNETSATVTVSPILTDWRETSADAGIAPLATWNAFFGTTPTLTFGAVAATGTVTGVGYFDWDITTLVKSWKDGTLTNYGMMLQAPGPLGDVGISDTDTPAFAPALIVTSPVPEPTAAGLGVLGVLGLALRRRRA